MNLKNLKRNQIIIIVATIMLVVAGYMSYTTSNEIVNTTITSSSVNSVDEIASIGDARLVSSNAISNSISNETIIADAVIDNGSENINSLYEENSIVTNNKNTKEIDEYFSSSKLNRDTMYSQMIDSYEKIMENPNISADQKTISQNEVKNINETKNKIMICENLIKTKGIEDCVMFVNGDSISIIVKTDKLKQEEIAQIQNIVSREMNVDIDNIHISNK